MTDKPFGQWHPDAQRQCGFWWDLTPLACGQCERCRKEGYVRTVTAGDATPPSPSELEVLDARRYFGGRLTGEEQAALDAVDLAGVNHAPSAPPAEPPKFQPVQLQDGYSQQWTCDQCGGDCLFCPCTRAAQAARSEASAEYPNKAGAAAETSHGVGFKASSDLAHPPAVAGEDARQDIACPFCREDDFDVVGLKLHLTAGHCDVFNATANCSRGTTPTPGEPT